MKALCKGGKIILALLLAFILFSAPSSHCEEDPDALPIVPSESFPDAFLNQDFWYDLSFLWFTRAAEAHFYFEKGERPSEYRAVLEAETKGFIGWLSSHRRHTYTSVMELVDTGKGKMLRSRYFSQEIVKGGKREVTEFILDYSKRTIVTRDSKPGYGAVVSQGAIPGNVTYNDVLSAYYNLRGGVFGVKRRGETFKLDTMPRRGVSHITVSIADGETEREKKVDMEDAKFLVRLDVDRRLFRQREGIVWIWADREFVPVMGEVKNVVLFGDVRGYKINKPPQTAGSTGSQTH